MHAYQDLITIFNACFQKEFNTCLVKGGDEPLYLPADADTPYHRLCFAHGFFSSALHECAHWLIAGKKRRLLPDFGYWYAPDGRDKAQQALFFTAEAKPQALEWILSMACGYPFRVSLDNLEGETGDTETFKALVYQEVLQFCLQGLSARAHRFREALCFFYKQQPDLHLGDFALENLKL